jgi:hypothetical protein
MGAEKMLEDESCKITKILDGRNVITNIYCGSETSDSCFGGVFNIENGSSFFGHFRTDPKCPTLDKMVASVRTANGIRGRTLNMELLPLQN